MLKNIALMNLKGKFLKNSEAHSVRKAVLTVKKNVSSDFRGLNKNYSGHIASVAVPKEIAFFFLVLRNVNIFVLICTGIHSCEHYDCHVALKTFA